MATTDPDLKELRDLFSHDSTEWKPIRDEGTEDMRYVAGDPWTTKDRLARDAANRPCLSADELSQYVNQIVNDVRMNKRAVKFSPTGNGANDQTAQFYADKWREIEYRSRAPMAYTTAFQNAVERSYGFVRVNYRYAHARAVHPDLWIDTVPNPNLITPDPEAVQTDLSDMTRCWVREAWDLDDFDRRWKQYAIKRHQGELMKVAPDWLKERTVFVGEYWKIRTKARTLLIVAPPAVEGAEDDQAAYGVFEDELSDQPLEPGHEVVGRRKVDDPQVVQQLTNGLEILDETIWPGRYIPIVGCFGKVLYVEETGQQKRQILSAVRLARDPQMLYAYLVTCEAEVIGAMPRFPYFVYEGQLSKTELDNLTKSVSEPIPVVKIKPTIESMPGVVLPFPQRNPYAPPLGEIEVAKEAARRAIQAAMGQTPLPTAAQRRNEKSGVALKHIDELGQRGSFHFVDHYLDMITQVGVIGEDLMDKVYDAEREVPIRKQNETAERVWINAPSRPGAIPTKGDHIVTVSTGQSYDSERQEASDFADTLIGSPAMQIVGPVKAPKLLAQSIKLKNLGPIGDEIAEIIDPSLGQDGQPSPEQVAQQAQQLQQENEMLKQGLAQAQQMLQTKQMEQDAKLKIAGLQEQSESQRNRENNEVKLAVAELSAKVERMALFLEERARLGATLTDSHEQAMDRIHDVNLAQMGHQQALEQGQQAGAIQSQQADQGAQIASQQAVQQAALSPSQEGA